MRDAFKKAQMRWHPDKFERQLLSTLQVDEKQAILNRVKIISQQINSEWDHFVRSVLLSASDKF